MYFKLTHMTNDWNHNEMVWSVYVAEWAIEHSEKEMDVATTTTKQHSHRTNEVFVVFSEFIKSHLLSYPRRLFSFFFIIMLDGVSLFSLKHNSAWLLVNAEAYAFHW